MARAKRAVRRAKVRSRLALLVAGLVLAAVGGVTYVLVDRSSSPSSPSVPLATPGSAQALALSRLQGHPLAAPECAPIKGVQWVYPIGPPVPGLPPVVASIRSSLYEVFAINYSCKQAYAWIRKLDRLKIPFRHNGNVTVLKGPPGWYCSAWPDANGHAYAGGCQSKGGGGCVSAKNGVGAAYPNGRGCKLTGGDQAFGWNWNVANRRVVYAYNANGVLRLFHVSGSDTNIVFRYLKGAYELDVLNTSGIGYLDGFTWKASPGWKVTGITKTSGANCALTHGKISCTGTVQPPSCLCTGDGGTVSIKFTAAPTKKHAGYLFGGSPTQFKVTKMTPVPYLIPGTPGEAAKRAGV